jgi:hypothetical protein
MSCGHSTRDFHMLNLEAFTAKKLSTVFVEGGKIPASY